MNYLLIHDKPLLVLPKLAVEIGLNEAIFLQQVHYWLQKSTHEYDDRKWIYNTCEEWGRQFPFWSVRTIRRIIDKLEKKGLLLSGNYNKLRFDKTKWYAINYDLLNRVVNHCAQSAQSKYPSCQERVVSLESSGVQFDLSNTRDYTENTTEIIVVEEDAPEFDNEGILMTQGAASELDTDSSRKKISLVKYRQQIIDKYIQKRSCGFDLSIKAEEALDIIIAEKIPLRIVLQGIDKAFDEFKPVHKRDKIRGLKYCVPIIFGLQAKSMKSYSKSKMVNSVIEPQETLPAEQPQVSDEELQELLSRMLS